MDLNEAEMKSISRELIEAEQNATPITNLTDRFPDVTLREAYAIQMKSLEAKLKTGQVVVGHKIGLCAKANQQKYCANGPIYGHIFSDMVVAEGEPISMSRLIRPIIEGEVCFVLKEELRGPGIDMAKVLAATVGVLPAFEIADDRYKEQKRKVVDPVSDNAGAAMVILGGKLTPITDIDLRLVGMVLEKDGEIVATGAGAAVLGNPAQAVASLANNLAEHNMSLRAGEFIISGSLTISIPIQGGSCYRATFDRLGSVSARFVR